MEVEWMMLANYAETPPNGLVYISGGAWDTINVANPFPDEATPPGASAGSVVAVFQGTVVTRLALHTTETDRDHKFQMTVLDADGGEIGHVAGEFRVERQEDHVPGWPHSGNIIVSLAGLPLPNFGSYTIALAINGDHRTERPFRVVKRY